MTIQDVEKAAVDLGAGIQAFDVGDQKAAADAAAADQVTQNANAAIATANAQASQSAADRDKLKQSMIDLHTTFDNVLDTFLHPTPPPAPQPK